MKKYRKKPIVIEAVQYDGSVKSAQSICDWANGLDKDSVVCSFVTIDGGKANDFQVHTLEGIMTAEPNDWIIKGIKGEFYPCKPDIFLQTYDKE